MSTANEFTPVAQAADAYFSRGMTYYEAKNYEIARADFNKIIAMNMHYIALAYYGLKLVSNDIKDYN